MEAESLQFVDLRFFFAHASFHNQIFDYAIDIFFTKKYVKPGRLFVPCSGIINAFQTSNQY